MADPSTQRRGTVVIRVIVVALVAAIGMTAFESLEQLSARWISPVGSHAISVLLASAAAAAVAAVLSRAGRKASARLEASRDLYLKVLEDFPSPIWRADSDRRVDYFNRAWFRFTGRSPNQELGEGWMKSVHPDDLEGYLLDRRVAFIRKEPFQAEYRLKRHDGAYRWMAENGRPIEDVDGSYLGFVGVCSDVSEIKEQAEKLEQLSTHDALTGLPNRRSFETALDRQVARSGRGVTGALLYMDVDNFKYCNDTRGHEFGDVVLQGVAEVLRTNARIEEMVARLGGDEFVLILERATSRTAKFVADRMRDGVRRFAALQGVELDLSVGVAIIDGKSTGSRLMRVADAAMYEAKQAGKGMTVVSGDEVKRSV